MDKKGHDMMDDMGKHALSRHELYMPQGRPEQGWPMRRGSLAGASASMQHKDREYGDGLLNAAPTPRPAEACTELGAEPTITRRRLGPVRGLERALLQRRPTFTFAAIVGLAIVAALVRACGGAA